MKTIVKIFALLIPVLVLSCEKQNVEDNSIPQIAVSVEVDDIVIPDTKVSHALNSEDNTKHQLAWKEGDQFSMFTYVNQSTGDHAYEVLNYSENRFTKRPGYKLQFQGNVPDFHTIYGDGVALAHAAFHPAATVDVTHTSGQSFEVVPSSAGNIAIPAIQDGTGWDYAIYCSRTSTSGSTPVTPSISNVKFSLANCMLRMRLKSNKEITGISLSKGSGGNGYLVGNVTKMICDGYKQNIYISLGCTTTTLNITNGGTLVEADAADYQDIYFAVRKLQQGVQYTFTFTASDNTQIVKHLTPKEEYNVGVFNLGSFTLTNWE
jgi:hypothetical protein